jgi:hypothetical protein
MPRAGLGARLDVTLLWISVAVVAYFMAQDVTSNLNLAISNVQATFRRHGI